MMPVVSSVVTNREWRALEDEYNLEPKSFVELGRRRPLADRRRRPGGSTGRPGPRSGDPSVHPPARVRPLLPSSGGSVLGSAGSTHASRPEERPLRGPHRRRRSTRSGTSSATSLVSANGATSASASTWLGGATSATPGARFRGRNRAGIFRWGRVCEIVAAEPYELVWRTVPTTLYPDSTEWTIRLRPADGGTEIEQTFTVVRGPKLLDILYGLMIPAHRDRTAALTEDLRRLGHLAAASTPAPTTTPAVASA